MQTTLRSLNKFFIQILLFLITLTGFQGFAQENCAGTGSSQVLCGDLSPINIADLISGEAAGGSWWMTAYGWGGSFDAESGIFTPDSQTQGIFMFSYYFSGDPDCGDASSTVTLTFTSGDALEQREGYSCQGDSATFNLNAEIALTTAGQQGGGTWIRTSGTGGIFDASAGTFECTPEATSSTFVYSAAGACGSFSCTFDVYRAQRPDPGAGQDGEMTLCEGTSATINLHDIITGEEIYNPTWTRISGTGGELDPLTGIFIATPETTTSVFRYRMASGAGMCGNDTSYATINVSACSTMDEACGADYWKANASEWCAAYSPNTPLSAVFNVPQPLRSRTLMQVLNLKGNGGPNNLAREAVTALLNICSENIDYPLPYGHSSQELIDSVNDAFAANGNAVNSLGTTLAELNQSGCPLELSRGGNQVLVSPNPFSDRLNISIAEYQGRATIEIFDIVGRLVKTHFAEITELNAPVEFATGFTPAIGQLYFIKIKTSHGITVIKSVGK